MTAAFEFKRLARSLGIIAVFAVVGPVVATLAFAAVFLVVGVPLLQLALEFFDLQALRSWLSVTIFLLLFFLLVATITPSIVTGIVFAIASVYCGLSSLWTAFAIAGCVVVGVVALGFFVTPSESAPVLVPSVKGLRQAAALALFLSFPAAVAAYLSWLFSRPLHSPS